MAIPLADIETWLLAGSIPTVNANWMPDSPAEVVVISGAGGQPPNMDGAFEVTHVYVRSRAATDAAAETLALQVHRLVTGVKVSFAAGGTWVKKVESIGGPPRFLSRDNDERTTYVAIYAFDCPT